MVVVGAVPTVRMMVVGAMWRWVLIVTVGLRDVLTVWFGHQVPSAMLRAAFGRTGTTSAP